MVKTMIKINDTDPMSVALMSSVNSCIPAKPQEFK